MADCRERRILSIQSHVVSGYVGNKCAAFPLQLLGFETDCINSVQFSNDDGYENGTRGQCMNDAQLGELIEGLDANGLDFYSHIISGYIGTDSFLRKLADVIKKLKAKNPNLMYICDPVMGDSEPVGWYVPKELLPIYRHDILPLADICVPNQFEAELLSGVKITDEASAFTAMKRLHALGPRVIVLSSTDDDTFTLKSLASRMIGGDGLESEMSECKFERYRINVPKLPLSFSGTGDLFTALLTAWLTKSHGKKWPAEMNLASALEKTIATMQAVLSRTFEHFNNSVASNNVVEIQNHALKELKLIQSRDDILDPKVVVEAVKVLD